MTVTRQGFNCKIEDRDNISIVVNVVGGMYTVEIRQEQEQTSCDIKYMPVTLRGLIKAMHNKYRLRGGWSPSCVKRGDSDMEDGV